ncbi:MAG: SAM-dependent chlorinase/fluorinase [Pirellulales bacterium]|nr:SAM-dependent chlorinase/fluorinase [Pirellulales bacterium]
MSIITLTTDFGEGSPYVAAMKGVILTIHPEVTIVDVTHSVPAQEIRRGALVLDRVTGRFPDGSIHVAVVDPGVGTERALVYAEIGAQRYLAPDNGLLSRLALRLPPRKIIKLTQREFWLENVSDTFHGRDVLAPVAARLSLGLEPERLGPPLEKLVMLSWPEVRITPTRIAGTILEIDSFGNLVTDVSEEMLAGRPIDERVRIMCGTQKIHGIHRVYGRQPPGTLIALINSHGNLELAVVNGNAARQLDIAEGTPVTLTWE